MAMDPYAPCPCGNGKKLKFCCADIADDIEKVYKKIEGDQPQAALKQVESLLAAKPDRSALIDLKASLELSLKKLDAARETIVRFMLSHPDSPAAQAQSAILEASTGHGHKGIAPLQNALELLSDEMPQRVLEAVGAVGHALLLDGDVFAARGHLLLYAGISPEKDNAAIDLLLRLNLESGLPLLLRQEYFLKPAPEGSPWKQEYDEAAVLSGRGLWREAEQKLVGLSAKHPQTPVLIYGLALVRGWLGDAAGLAQGMHDFAGLGVPRQEAVEAEALAQLVDPAIEEPSFSMVKRGYSVPDADVLTEALTADARIEPYDLSEQETGDQATPPRASFILLDREPVEPETEFGIDEVPNVIAFLSLYGKRTDRDAQLEVTTDEGELLKRSAALLAEIADSELGESAADEVLAEKSHAEGALSWRWRLPERTPPDVRQRLLAERRRRAILSDWPASPLGALRGKTADEARGQEESSIALEACVLLLEQASSDPDELPLFDELRQQLGIAPLEGVAADAGDEAPLSRFTRYDAAGASLEQLLSVLQRASLGGASVAALLAARALVARSKDAGEADLSAAFRQAIRLEPNPKRAQEHAASAVAWSEARGHSAGEWRVALLEVAISSGDVEQLERTLQEIREKHAGEADVAEAAYRVLLSAGLIPPEQAAPVGAGPEAEPSGVWTPGQESPPAGGEEKSGLWLPS